VSRIVSLLPSATEIVYALGLGDRLVGVSHSCDYPREVRGKPVFTRPRFAPEGLSSGEIDAAVRDALRRFGSVYQVDAEGLAAAQPDLILTQGVCEVCAVPTRDAEAVALRLPSCPTVLTLDAHDIAGVLDTIRAVGRAAWAIIKDVRDQFREDPGIMAGTSKPDYARSVDIVTRSALREMVVPGLLAVATPVSVGLFFRFVRITPGLLPGEPLGGTLMVGTIVGVLMALVLNTGGGAWDNAKKFIEAGNLGGKGSPTHKAAVVGDTVGDPFKDTAGPSLHILVKLLSTITLVIAPLLI